MKNKQKIVLALFSSAVLLSGCATDQSGASDDGESQEDTVTVTEDRDGTQTDVTVEVSSGITEAVEVVDEAVVSVLNMQTGSDLGSYGYLFDFYDLPTPENSEEDGELEEAGSGSGVVYKTDGGDAYIVTNNHVVEGSDAVEVLFINGEKVAAEIIGSDVWTDLSVLKISAEHVTKIAEFGDSDNLVVGEPAIAIGSPLGTEFASSVTSGIISGKGRSVPVDTNADGVPDWNATAIQTDAAINPGNSGGALVNIQGQLIGINSMKISTSTVEGMGFAIPSNDVKDIVAQLEENGEVIRPYLGIQYQPLSFISEADQQNTLQLPESVTEGVVLTSVVPGSPADEAGLEAYDVIVSYNGEPVTDGVNLRQHIYSTDVNTTVEITFYRGQAQETVSVPMMPADDVLDH
ncbi:MAG: trypsin-like peptidase domain-containing protein [Atopococcus tabaci]|uniref:Trypsin-like peptidase domain-containing protein n=1 Tax=Atopococcus tabaci TaxID=269774 RepID=A0AA43UCX8_9LACT|nr:trypsin-like peptidase domain-containing protein [Atopococcus tabaci]